MMNRSHRVSVLFCVFFSLFFNYIYIWISEGSSVLRFPHDPIDN